MDFENIDNRIQYSSVEDAIKAHAKTYSFNIESILFPQLTEEQQKLWRKEIEQACISGGDAVVSLCKPSDEQMKAIKNVRKILHTKDIYSEENHFIFNFEELIRMLEKLREK